MNRGMCASSSMVEVTPPRMNSRQREWWNAPITIMAGVELFGLR